MRSVRDRPVGFRMSARTELMGSGHVIPDSARSVRHGDAPPEPSRASPHHCRRRGAGGRSPPSPSGRRDPVRISEHLRAGRGRTAVFLREHHGRAHPQPRRRSPSDRGNPRRSGPSGLGTGYPSRGRNGVVGPDERGAARVAYLVANPAAFCSHLSQPPDRTIAVRRNLPTSWIIWPNG
jgi:hypothetical protein